MGLVYKCACWIWSAKVGVATGGNKDKPVRKKFIKCTGLRGGGQDMHLRATGDDTGASKRQKGRSLGHGLY